MIWLYYIIKKNKFKKIPILMEIQTNAFLRKIIKNKIIMNISVCIKNLKIRKE